MNLTRRTFLGALTGFVMGLRETVRGEGFQFALSGEAEFQVYKAHLEQVTQWAIQQKFQRDWNEFERLKIIP